MAFKMKGFSPFTQNDDETKYYAEPGGMLPEVELTAKHTNKSRRRAKDRETLAELHENPVIKAVHGGTEKAASKIYKGAENLAMVHPVGGSISKGVRTVKKVSKLKPGWFKKARQEVIDTRDAIGRWRRSEALVKKSLDFMKKFKMDNPKYFPSK